MMNTRMNASSWSAAYARRRDAARAARAAIPLTPDEIDDRQVDLIEGVHRDIDEWLADGSITQAQADRLRSSLPERLMTNPTSTGCRTCGGEDGEHNWEAHAATWSGNA